MYLPFAIFCIKFTVCLLVNTVYCDIYGQTLAVKNVANTAVNGILPLAVGNHVVNFNSSLISCNLVGWCKRLSC